MPAEPLQTPASGDRWLSIVGIGEDGISGLGEAARHLIASAEIVFGGKRHLALAAKLITGEVRAWPSPFEGASRAHAGLRGRNVCVLASGDPFLHGVGARLPAASTIRNGRLAGAFRFQPRGRAAWLAAARNCDGLAAWQGFGSDPPAASSGCAHPRSDFRCRGPGRARAAALRSRFSGHRGLRSRSARRGGERIGASRRRGFRSMPSIRSISSRSKSMPSPTRRILPLGFGLADDLFEHDGQITKREVRAITLSALAPRRGELLWDVGAGSGSVSSNGCWQTRRCAPSPSRRCRTGGAHRPQCRRLGRARPEDRRGAHRPRSRGLPRPDAIFIGGGGSDGCPRRGHRCVEARRPSRRERRDARDGGAASGEAWGLAANSPGSPSRARPSAG